MADIELWIAGLTSGTAIIASWVTSRGHTRAARDRVRLEAAAQRDERRREIRRVAYLDLITHTQDQRKILWAIRDAHKSPVPEERATVLHEQLAAAREAYDTFVRLMQVVSLEGPSQVAECAESMRAPLALARREVQSLAEARSHSLQALEHLNLEIHTALLGFISEANKALNSM
ncbi:hypothetical protein [Streptomyces sp. C36]|uniref:hypothetical protein n=1 Tax=Streptomyces sp. C36 TaxID=3237122 RepID=UPI0034C683CA